MAFSPCHSENRIRGIFMDIPVIRDKDGQNAVHRISGCTKPD